MERSRITLARLMAVVGVIALEIAVARALYLHDVELALGLALMGLVSQFGLFRAIRDRGRAQAFWSGFVIIGLATMGTFAWAVCSHDSRMFSLWRLYTRYADGVLSTIPRAPRFSSGLRNDLANGTAVAIVWFLPQLLAAMIGGLSAIFVIRDRFKRVNDRRLGASSS